MPSLRPSKKENPTHKMKNIYATLLAATAILVSATSDAQSFGNPRTKGQPVSFTVNNRFAQPIENGLRGGGAPPNDLCSAVTASPLAVPGTMEFTGTTVNATNAGDAEAGSPLEQTGDTATVWHAFTTGACSNLRVEYCGTPTFPYTYWIALSLNCPAGATIDDFILATTLENCADTNLVMVYEGLPAGTYYLPVYGEPGTAGPYTINLIADACASAPANDECDGAIALTSTAVCNPIPFLTTGATSTMDAIECDGFTSPESNDVWFSFVATDVDQTIAVQGFNESDPFVELFEGTCAGLTSLACQDTTFPQSAGENTSEQLIYSGLTVGTTYFVRVYDYGHASPDHSFEICVTEGLGNNIGIEEATADTWNLFPNPGTGVFNLQYIGASGRGTIEVFDVSGRSVYNQQTQLNNGTVRTLDLTGVAPGNYNVRLTMNGARTEQRLMVK